MKCELAEKSHFELQNDTGVHTSAGFWAGIAGEKQLCLCVYPVLFLNGAIC